MKLNHKQVKIIKNEENLAHKLPLKLTGSKTKFATLFVDFRAIRYLAYIQAKLHLFSRNV